MPWGVDQVDQETRAILGLLDECQVVFAELVEQGDGPARKSKRITYLLHISASLFLICTLQFVTTPYLLHMSLPVFGALMFTVVKAT